MGTTPKLIGIIGKAGSGKSVAADLLEELHGFTLEKFAGPLKAMLYAFYESTGMSWSDAYDRIEGHLKETPDPKLCGVTPRLAMQTLGQEWGRECISQDLWLGAAESSVKGLLEDGQSVVIDDVRYQNEADMIKSLGGIIILIHRDTSKDVGNHISEAGVGAIDPDYIIINNGTVEDLKISLDMALLTV